MDYRNGREQARKQLRFAAALACSVLLHVVLFRFQPALSSRGAGGGSNGSFESHRLQAVVAPFAEARPATAMPDSSPERGRGKLAQSDARGAYRQVLSTDTPASATRTFPLLDDYLPRSVLTEFPMLIGTVDPAPAGGKVDGVVGEIELVLLISSEGDVDAVLVARATLPDHYVDYAKEVFAKARFVPGRVGTRPVRSRLRILVGPGVGE